MDHVVLGEQRQGIYTTVSRSPRMDPIVQYLIINRELLALDHGVLAAQAAHAAVAGYVIAADNDSAPAWQRLKLLQAGQRSG